MVPPERVACVCRAADDEHRRRQAELEQQRPGMFEHPRVAVVERESSEAAERPASIQAFDELAQRYHVVAPREPTQLLGKMIEQEMHRTVAARRSVACGPHVVVAQNDARVAESSHQGGYPHHPSAGIVSTATREPCGKVRARDR